MTVNVIPLPKGGLLNFTLWRALSGNHSTNGTIRALPEAFKGSLQAGTNRPEGLRLKLLGPPQIHLGQQAVRSLNLAKAQALFFYLAMKQCGCSRRSLATLLWRDKSEADGLRNLRVNLVHLNRHFGPYLLVDGRTLAFNRTVPYWLDVDEFERLSRLGLRGQDRPDKEALEVAASLYKGDFLEGFDVKEAPAFEEWLRAEQARLHEILIQTLTMLVEVCWTEHDLAGGIRYARRLLALEPWREETHRQLMRLLVLNGRRGAALAQYKSCCALLAQELGVAPAPETTDLYRQIQAAIYRPVAPVL